MPPPRLPWRKTSEPYPQASPSVERDLADAGPELAQVPRAEVPIPLALSLSTDR